MKHIKYYIKLNTEMHKTGETQIYMAHRIWATYTEK